MTSQQLGSAAEQTALEFLLERDLTLIDRNFSCQMGEIDLIMRDRNTVIFVEVRLRNDTRYGSGAETITRHKIRRIINTAQYFLKKHIFFEDLDYRFDVISMDESIDWIQNAFTLDY